MTQKEIDKLIDKKLTEMFNEDPVKLSMFMVVQMGKQAVDANAETITIKQESDIKGYRYEITVKTKIKKLRKL